MSTSGLLSTSADIVEQGTERERLKGRSFFCHKKRRPAAELSVVYIYPRSGQVWRDTDRPIPVCMVMEQEARNKM